MARAAVKLRFFLDNNVPDSIGRYLQGRGHSVQRQRFYIPADSPDPVVAVTAMKADRILITQDKDFNGQRFHQERFAALNRVFLNGQSHTLLPALKEYVHLVEAQWEHCQKTKGERLVVHIKQGQMKFRK